MAVVLGALLVLPAALRAQASVPVIATVLPQGSLSARASSSLAALPAAGADARVDSRLEVSGSPHQVVTAVTYRSVDAPGPREPGYRFALPAAGEEVSRVVLERRGTAAAPDAAIGLTYYSLRLQAPLEQSTTTRLRVVYVVASPSH